MHEWQPCIAYGALVFNAFSFLVIFFYSRRRHSEQFAHEYLLAAAAFSAEHGGEMLEDSHVREAACGLQALALEYLFLCGLHKKRPFRGHFLSAGGALRAHVRHKAKLYDPRYVQHILDSETPK